MMKYAAAALALAAALVAPSMVGAQTYDYTFTAADPVAPVHYADGAPCSFASPGNRNYQTIDVTVTTGGVYLFYDEGTDFLGTDAGVAIYSTFDPTNTAANCLASVDYMQSVTLTPGAYTLVLANSQPNDYSGFRVRVAGAAPLVTGGVSTVPTMSEWAMILFGTILAGGSALYIQRRRFTV